MSRYDEGRPRQEAPTANTIDPHQSTWADVLPDELIEAPSAYDCGRCGHRHPTVLLGPEVGSGQNHCDCDCCIGACLAPEDQKLHDAWHDGYAAGFKDGRRPEPSGPAFAAPAFHGLEEAAR